MGISTDRFVVVTSNVFAVLGLNSLFFAIRGVMGLFKYLKHGVSFVLFFIGLKMIAGMHVPTEHWFKTHTWVSLVVIAALLGGAIVVSLLHERLAAS
jgi:tellurite resistance protein TerC